MPPQKYFAHSPQSPIFVQTSPTYLTMNPYQHIHHLFAQVSTATHNKQAFIDLLNSLIEAIFEQSKMKDALEIILHEMLQNADDSMFQHPSAGNMNIALLNDRYLIIQHNGKPFDAQDVEALCSINGSTKVNAAGQIGYKGIGFKSIFSISEWVYIHSGGYSFKFDQNDPAVQGQPWQVAPIWVDPASLDEKLKASSQDPNYTVFIAIDIRKLIQNEQDRLFNDNLEGTVANKEEDQVQKLTNVIKEALLEMFWKQAERLLFLNNLKEIRIGYLQQQLSTTIARSAGHCSIHQTSAKASRSLHWRLYNEQVIIKPATQAILNKNNKYPKKLQQASHAPITLAVPYEQKANGTIELKPQEKSMLYSYLPIVENSLEFPFIANADFSLRANREKIEMRDPWNYYLMAAIGSAQMAWIREMIVADRALRHQAFRLLKPHYINPAKDSIQNAFNQGIDNALTNIAFVPVHSTTQANRLVTIDQAVWDNMHIEQKVPGFCFWLEKNRNNYLIDLEESAIKKLLDNKTFSNRIQTTSPNYLASILKSNPDILTESFYPDLSLLLKLSCNDCFEILQAGTQQQLQSDVYWINIYKEVVNATSLDPKGAKWNPQTDLLLAGNGIYYPAAQLNCIIHSGRVIPSDDPGLIYLPPRISAEDAETICERLEVTILDETQHTLSVESATRALDWENRIHKALLALSFLTKAEAGWSEQYKTYCQKASLGEPFAVYKSPNIALSAAIGTHSIAVQTIQIPCWDGAKLYLPDTLHEAEVIYYITDDILNKVDATLSKDQYAVSTFSLFLHLNDCDQIASWLANALKRNIPLEFKTALYAHCLENKTTLDTDTAALVAESETAYTAQKIRESETSLKTDTPAAEAEINDIRKEIGDAGEEYVFNLLKQQAKLQHKKYKVTTDSETYFVLSDSKEPKWELKWLKGEQSPYDLVIHDSSSTPTETYIEVKTTPHDSPQGQPIYMSKYEYDFWEKNRDNYLLYRVYGSETKNHEVIRWGEVYVVMVK